MFTHSIETEIHIQASPQQVWAVLTDFPRHAQWNPFIRHISGELKEGESLSVVVQPVGGSPLRFRPRLWAVQAQRLLSWRGRLGMPGVFDGEHSFEVVPDAEGVNLFHRERFSGVLVPLLRRSLERGTRPGFEAMNQALRQRAEHA